MKIISIRIRIESKSKFSDLVRELKTPRYTEVLQELWKMCGWKISSVSRNPREIQISVRFRCRLVIKQCILSLVSRWGNLNKAQTRVSGNLNVRLKFKLPNQWNQRLWLWVYRRSIEVINIVQDPAEILLGWEGILMKLRIRIE